PTNEVDQLTIEQAIDRIYTQPASQTQIIDHGHQRTIMLEHLNASDIVVWNPWQEGSQSMADMADDGFQQMLCVETARINQPLITDNQITSTVGVTITVEPYSEPSGTAP